MSSSRMPPVIVVPSFTTASRQPNPAPATPMPLSVARAGEARRVGAVAVLVGPGRGGAGGVRAGDLAGELGVAAVDAGVESADDRAGAGGHVPRAREALPRQRPLDGVPGGTPVVNSVSGALSAGSLGTRRRSRSHSTETLRRRGSRRRRASAARRPAHGGHAQTRHAAAGPAHAGARRAPRRARMPSGRPRPARTSRGGGRCGRAAPAGAARGERDRASQREGARWPSGECLRAHVSTLEHAGGTDVALVDSVGAREEHAMPEDGRNPRVLAIDAGGTMTDTFIVDDAGGFVVGKAQTTPEDESVGLHALGGGRARASGARTRHESSRASSPASTAARRCSTGCSRARAGASARS